MHTHVPALLLAIAAAGCATYVSNLDSTPTNDLPNPVPDRSRRGAICPTARQVGRAERRRHRQGRRFGLGRRTAAAPTPIRRPACRRSSTTAAPARSCRRCSSSTRRATSLRSFGAGMFVFPHKIYVDRDGNVWVVDMRGAERARAQAVPARTAAGPHRRQVQSRGKVLLTIGKPGVAGNPPDALTEPTSIVVAPNGDLFITEGHSGQARQRPPDTVARISQFTKDGKFIKSFGKLGSGPVEFTTPHDITMDAQGRLFVADRGNNRIQILDQDGSFIAEWKQFGRPSGIYIRNDLIYVADSESNGVAPQPGMAARHPHRQPQGRQSALPHPRSARAEGHQRGGRRRGGREGQRLRRRGRAAATVQARQVAQNTRATQPWPVCCIGVIRTSQRSRWQTRTHALCGRYLPTTGSSGPTTSLRWQQPRFNAAKRNEEILPPIAQAITQ